MPTIVSRRHPVHFYFVLLFLLTLLSVGGAFALITFSNKVKGGSILSVHYMFAVLGMLALIAACAILISWFRHVPRIEVRDKSFSIHNEVYYFADIEQIILAGKFPFPPLLGSLRQGTRIFFKNGKTKTLYDNFYRNNWEWKSCLKSGLTGDEDALQGVVFSNSVLVDKNFIPFNDNHLLSVIGIFHWVISLCLTMTLFIPAAYPKSLFFLPIVSVFFVNSCYDMRYFMLSEKLLVIRTTLLPFDREIYELNNIVEVSLERQYRSPRGLRIVSRDGRDKFYAAGTLSKETWFLLREYLERYGIPVTQKW